MNIARALTLLFSGMLIGGGLEMLIICIQIYKDL